MVIGDLGLLTGDCLGLTEQLCSISFILTLGCQVQVPSFEHDRACSSGAGCYYQHSLERVTESDHAVPSTPRVGD